MADYLDQGGAVQEVERGLSGRVNPNGPLKSDNAVFQQPKTGRTYVPEVIAAIDARRKPAAPPQNPAPAVPAKKLSMMILVNHYVKFGNNLQDR